MSIWFAALILALAVAATYLFCLRPMRRGECGMAATAPDQTRDRQQELADLRHQVARLQAENAWNDADR
ncbi:MAG: hypothetical protein GEV07_25550 [Streptosporangiales bacterium]|nr:hypothetical protein [Streptosporangiales bacterium]